MADTKYVYFKPNINLAHMAKYGEYRVTRAYADDLLKQPGNLGEVVRDAPDVVEPGEAISWSLDTSPADYIERYRERYEAGDVSPVVKERYELAEKLVAEQE